MTCTQNLGLALVCLVLLGARLQAGEPVPTVTLVLSARNRLLENVRAVMVDMARSPNQYATLKDMVDDVLRHTDPEAPLSCRAYLIGAELREVYTAQVPTALEFRNFRNNLESIGFRSRRDPWASRGEELFRLSGSDSGSIRYDARTKSVLVVPIGRTSDPALREASMELARAVTGPAPTAILGGRDIVLLVENNAARFSERKAAFSKRLKDVDASIERKLPLETGAEHEFRRAVASQQTAELERTFVEAQRLMVGSKVSIKDGRLTVDASLTARSDTSLARSIDRLGESANEFSAVDSAGALITININLPLDEMRREHLRELSKLWSTALQERINARVELPLAARQSEKDLVDLLTRVLNEVSDFGEINGFVRVYQKDGRYSTIGGVRVADGMRLPAALEIMAGRKDSAVNLEVEKVNTPASARAASPVAIHSISVTHAMKGFPEFLARDGMIYIATGEKTLWFASGDGALDLLRKAIQDTMAAGPKPNAEFVNANLALSPWLKAWDRWNGTKHRTSLRRAAMEGLARGNDLLIVRLWRSDEDPNQIFGEAIVESGVLCALGNVAAQVIRDNVEQ